MNDSCARTDAIPPLVGHRGASHGAPENTLPSYRLAWQEGADRIEGDFWLTGDGRIVCIHDPTTARTAPDQPEADVRRTSHAELAGYDVGSWKGQEFAGTTIPTLDDILAEMVPDGAIYVEIKQDTEKIISALLQVVASSPASLEQITLISFSPGIVRQAKQLAPEMRVFLLHDLEHPENEASGSVTTEELLAEARICHADGLGLGNSPLIDAELVRRIREAGLEFHVWTVNAVEEALRYMALGVDSITTDRPGGLRQEIRAFLGRKSAGRAV